MSTMEKKSRSSFWVVLLGATAALAVVAVLAVVVLGGDDDQDKPARAGAQTAQPAGQLPEFALNFPKTWKRVAAEAKPGEAPRAVIQRKDGSGIVTMTINGPVKQSLDALRGDMKTALTKKFPGLRELQFKRIKVEAGDGLLSTWVSAKGRVQSNLVVPAGKVSYSLDAVVTPGKEKTATEVGKIYAAFDAELTR